MTREITLQLEGVKCAGCTANVENALKKLPVESVHVDLDTKTASIQMAGDTPTADELVDAVRKAGYGAKVIG